MSAAAADNHNTIPDDHSSTDVDESKPASTHDQHRSDVEQNASAVSEKPPAAAAAPAGPPVGPPGMPEPPDGGWFAWLQIAGCFCIFFNTWGNLNTFGIFQTYYETGDLFTSSSSDIAWIGSLQAFFLLSGGVFSGPIYDKGYLRTLLAVGSVLVVLGYMMLSLCTELWQVILSQGFCIGIGGGLIFSPALAILPSYFRRKLGMAIGVAAAGSSMGGIIYPIVFFRLYDTIGFPWTVRVIGFISLATLLVPCLVLKQRFVPKQARKMFDVASFTDLPYLLLIFGCIVGFIGLYVVLFYISFYGEAKGITDTSLSFYIIPILNAASVFGRTLPNILGDKIGPFNVFVPGAFVTAIVIFCMIPVESVGGIIVLAIFFGFFSGIYVSLPPVCIAALTADKSKIGTRIGQGFAIVSVSVLIGGPGGGAIVGTDAADYNWTGLFVFGGVCTLASGMLFVFLRSRLVGFKLAKV